MRRMSLRRWRTVKPLTRRDNISLASSEGREHVWIMTGLSLRAKGKVKTGIPDKICH